MCSPKRDTMHLHNKPSFTVIFCLLFCILVAGSAFAQPQAQSSQGQHNQTVQPTPLPSDIDPADPALPVCMRSATPAPPPTSTNTPPNTKPSSSDADIVPSSKAPVGQVIKGKSGYEMIKRVQNIMLPVTVVDDRRRLVTNLTRRDFEVYEKGEPQEIIDVRREDVPVSIGI